MTPFARPFAALTAMLLAGCTPAAEPVATAAPPAVARTEGPALWRIADEDTVIWLFGTIHVLPPELDWRNAAIDRAIAESDQLVIETVLSDDTRETALLLMRLGITPGLPPIAERVDPDQYQPLAAMIARGPYPESFLDGLESWAAALMLVGVTINDLGLSSDTGAEEALESSFEQAGKPISGLETPEQQFGYFDTLPEDVQRYFLSTVIDTPEDVRTEFDAMLDSWTHGDEAAIAHSFDDELSESEPLRDALIVQRNRNWARWIAVRLDQPGTVFVAVGAGHLVGRDSVQVYLREVGIESRRVQ